MHQVKVQLLNCYGIRELSHTFDFSQRKVYALYAPNGSMKSSFAQTFQDIANGKASTDRIFPSRATTRQITDESDVDLPPESVLVLPPYDEFFSHSEKTSTLLLNNTLRKEYEQLHLDINRSKTSFLQAMKRQSGSKKKRLDHEIALAFTKNDDEESFYQALERVSAEIEDQSDSPFAHVQYDSIFDDKILEALKTPSLTAAIHDYIIRYNELLEASTYFKRGVFEYYNAGQIARTLANNGFFDAKHSLTLHADTKTEITTQKQLEGLISQEMDHIASDSQLKTRFAAIKKQLEKNAKLREFQRYLCDDELLLPHLAKLDLFGFIGGS